MSTLRAFLGLVCLLALPAFGQGREAAVAPSLEPLAPVFPALEEKIPSDSIEKTSHYWLGSGPMPESLPAKPSTPQLLKDDEEWKREIDEEFEGRFVKLGERLGLSFELIEELKRHLKDEDDSDNPDADPHLVSVIIRETRVVFDRWVELGKQYSDNWDDEQFDAYYDTQDEIFFLWSVLGTLKSPRTVEELFSYAEDKRPRNGAFAANQNGPIPALVHYANFIDPSQRDKVFQKLKDMLVGPSPLYDCGDDYSDGYCEASLSESIARLNHPEAAQFSVDFHMKGYKQGTIADVHARTLKAFLNRPELERRFGDEIRSTLAKPTTDDIDGPWAEIRALGLSFGGMTLLELAASLSKFPAPGEITMLTEKSKETHVDADGAIVSWGWSGNNPLYQEAERKRTRVKFNILAAWKLFKNNDPARVTPQGQAAWARAMIEHRDLPEILKEVGFDHALVLKGFASHLRKVYDEGVLPEVLVAALQELREHLQREGIPFRDLVASSWVKELRDEDPDSPSDLAELRDFVDYELKSKPFSSVRITMARVLEDELFAVAESQGTENPLELDPAVVDETVALVALDDSLYPGLIRALQYTMDRMGEGIPEFLAQLETLEFLGEHLEVQVNEKNIESQFHTIWVLERILRNFDVSGNEGSVVKWREALAEKLGAVLVKDMEHELLEEYQLVLGQLRKRI